MSYKELIDTAEALVRSGQIAKAAQALKRVQLAKIPDSQRLALANLFRRTAQASFGLKILAPRIRSDRELARAASADELSEYAVLLMRVGAVQEAIAILRRLPAAPSPQVYFNLALAQITQWDYAGAIENLRLHLEHTQDGYAKRVTEMNLAAAYYYTHQPDQATQYARQVHATPEAGRLRANALEILARIAIDAGRLNEASNLLSEAATLLREAKTYDQLFIEGCRAYLDALKSKSTKPIEAYRSEALRRGRFESVREADWFKLRIEPDQALFGHLYFGTPYTGLRRHFCESLKLAPSSTMYVLGSGETKLDILALPPGKSQGLIAIAARDFYRPASVGAVFGQLLPDEYFDINTAGLRLRQLAHRARSWLTQQGYELTLESERSLYRCVPGPSLSLIIPEEVPSLTRTERVLQAVLNAYPPESEFSLHEALMRLGAEKSSLRSAIKVGLEQGRLFKYGAGSRTVYISK